MRILMYGAGVIGSIYAVKFVNAGYAVSLFARGNRLRILQEKGLLYQDEQSVKKANLHILDTLDSNDIFDYIFVTVRYEQIHNALASLKGNAGENIVTMVNNPNGYTAWEEIIGKGKLIPGFAGAGGQIENDVLQYRLTPKFVQPTIFGEIDGTITNRIILLQKIFNASKVPCSISKNMDAWQKSHIAMVTALANGIYFDGGDVYTTAKNKKAVRFMSSSLRHNFRMLKKAGIPIEPPKLDIFTTAPLWLMDIVLRNLYQTKFAETLINHHAQIAKEEMQTLDREFKAVIKKYGCGNKK
ncbi:MAG TPA: ketopantoate reductase [Treponema sp.]|nr:ketopantoate reductase [Treponema sp.]